MSLSQKIDADLKAAMIAKDEVKLSTLRILKSAFKYAAIEKKVGALEERDAMQVIQKQIKQRRESIDQFQKNGRPELAEKEQKEVVVLESYMPQQLSDDALKKGVEDAIRETGAASKKDFGKVMKLLTEKFSGQAEPKRISDAVNALLK